MIGADGEQPTSFSFNGHEVYASCGVTHENNYFIYGDDDLMRQVLKLDNCGLTKLEPLPFNHHRGACGSSNGTIFLFFSSETWGPTDYKQCRRATSPLGPWTFMEPSNYDHRYTALAASQGDEIVDFEIFLINYL